MTWYRYTGRELETGRRLKGRLEAGSPRQAVSTLRKEGMLVVSLREEPVQSGPAPGLRRFKARALAYSTRRLSVLLQAGLPFAQALMLLAEQEEITAHRKAWQAVLRRVEEGSSFEAALQSQPRVFPHLISALVAAGEKSGTLPESLNRISQMLERIDRLRRTLLSTLLYPLTVLATALGVLAVLLLFVVPGFEELFLAMNIPLPLPTRMIILAGQWALWVVSPFLVLLCACAALAVRTSQSKSSRRFLDRWLLKTPFVGRLMASLTVARSIGTLSTLLRCGVPILEAIVLSAATSGNSVIRSALNLTARELERGRSVSEALDAAARFPPVVIQMAAIGEQAGELATMLESASRDLESEAEFELSQLLSALEPALMLGLGVAVGIIVVSIYLPIFGLLGTLSVQ